MEEKVLIISHMPIKTKCTGPSLRFINIAKILNDRFKTKLYARKIDDNQKKTLSFLTTHFWKSILNATIVYSQPSRLRYLLMERLLNKKIIIDLYDPTDIENLEMYKNSNSFKSKLIKNYSSFRLKFSILIADYFVCSNEKQKDYWIGYIQGMGVNISNKYKENEQLNNIIGYLPFGIDENIPKKNDNPIAKKFKNIKENDKVFIWAGGIWNWFDSKNLVRAMNEIKDREEIKVLFLGVPDNQSLQLDKNKNAKETIELAKSLGLYNKTILFNDEWVDYEKRHEYLLNSYAGISLHFDNLETKFSFRTRILDYIWCGLPYISSEKDYFSELNKNNLYGINTTCNDVLSIKNAIIKMADDKDFYKKSKENISKLKNKMTWKMHCHDLIKKIYDFKRRKKRTKLYIIGYFIMIPFKVLYCSIMED